MITPTDALTVPLLAALPHALRSRIVARAADVRANVGEWIIREGDPPYFWIVLEGEIEAVRTLAGRERQTTTWDPGEFFGEVPLMLGSTATVSCRAIQPSRLMRTDPTDFHAMVTEATEASAMLAQTLVRRVGIIRDIYAAAEVTQATIVGDRYDFACHDIRDFLSRNQVPFDWLDPSDPADRPYVAAELLEANAYPVVVTEGRSLVQPSQRDLAESLGLQTRPTTAIYDLAIVGGGPAGLAAAVYGASEGLRTMMIESEAPGGQAGTSSRIENYLGFPGGVSGGDLAHRALLQAKQFGTEILVTRNVVELRVGEPTFSIVLDGDETIAARAVVIATGVSWRPLECDGSELFVGRGVYYGAARTEALGTRGRDVFIVGGGNSAGQAAMFFANYARSVTVLVRGDALAKSMSHYLIEQLNSKANISVELRTTVARVLGEDHLEAIVTREGSEAEVERHADALFVFIGADAETDWLPRAIECDAGGYVRTGRDLTSWTAARRPFPFETSTPGVFAAGDVRSDSVKRVASAVGEGSIVIAYVHQYLDSLAASR
ncbi:MAG: pyridine nucleotide-disulfide oxidoreductase [Candidatus Eremiobacteraeota bacterium]|nr:pyridine nucleotide-disulfide oxidoreductase [Candidatus Eremiobacteraeota bacterium]